MNAKKTLHNKRLSSFQLVSQLIIIITIIQDISTYIDIEIGNLNLYTIIQKIINFAT